MSGTALPSVATSVTAGEQEWRYIVPRKTLTHAARILNFWSYVDRTGECWVWTGNRNTRGYGSFWNGSRDERAHRFAYRLVFGPIAPGMFVCHRCDNPGCVRPAHLFQGTHSDNMRDAHRKGRLPQTRPGRGNHYVKLSEDQVREIRLAWGTGESQSSIARRYQVASMTVSGICRLKSRKNVI